MSEGSGSGDPRHVPARRRWVVLSAGALAQAATTVFVTGPAFLLPLLHEERGIPLAQASLIVSAPAWGMVLTLVAWGALADRIGERRVIASGLTLTALAALGAVLAGDYLVLGVFLFLGGMSASSVNAASGRLIVGWFPRTSRGLVMGIRQACQPLGVALAAVTIPPLAASGGVSAAMALPAGLAAALAVFSLFAIVDPPRLQPAVSGVQRSNPYRRANGLWRIHAVSVLLVVPQNTMSMFCLLWLSTLGWPPTAAGLLVSASQLLGAAGRIGVGGLSDRVGSRVRPMRWVSCAAVLAMGAMAVSGLVPMWLSAVIVLVATPVAVASNGLSYTAVAEIAGQSWSGRALGVQNTGQFLVASVAGPAVAALIAMVGYPWAFATVALAPALAVPLVPRTDENGPTEP